MIQIGNIIYNNEGEVALGNLAEARFRLEFAERRIPEEYVKDFREMVFHWRIVAQLRGATQDELENCGGQR